jgi:hypothetical protein
MQFWKSIIAGLIGLSLSGAVFSGDRMGNGGDIRRFRVSRALRDIRWASGALDQVFSSGKCGDLIDAEIEGVLPRLQSVSELLSFSEARWSFASDLPVGDRPKKCVKYSLPSKSTTGYLEYSFFYENCPKNYSRNFYIEQVLRPIQETIFPEYEIADLGEIFDRLVTNTNECAFRNIGMREPSDAGNYRLIRSDIWKDEGRLQKTISEACEVIYRNLEKRLGTENSKCGNYCFPAVVEIPGKLEAGYPDLREIPYSEIMTELARTNFVLNKTLDSCAQTKPERGQPVYFNPSVCGLMTDTLDLAWILAHEMAHHFGIRDEYTADTFAASIVAMGARK